uniref:Protocadherin-16 n=1 Tax=Denticeps clupeoides TaxID=299321 RepID=A0AAY4A8E4_9TELE
MDSGALLLFLLLLCVCGRAGAQVSHLRLSVEEGLPAGTVVGDIRAALPRGTRAGGFFISESGDSHVFRDLEIHGDTGIISTAVVLDRESRDEYEFAAATLTGDVVRVTVAVEDVNDHSPVFPSEIVALAVSELSPPGTTFELEGARDQDVGSFGTQGYQIINSDMAEMFKVGARGGGGGLDLVLLGRLDRESRDFYNLTVEAFDGGVPRRTGRLQVHVNVSDENDNPPVFDRTEYRAAVRENAPRLTPVCRVQATDLDLGVNSLLTYEIVRRQGDPSEHFLIDESTGVIRVNKPLDREAQTFYELIVRARDGGTQPESSSTFVGIRVLDVNDNSPTINILFLSESGEPQVSEGAALEEYVARISASDPDLGEGNKVHVYLQGGEGKFLLKQTDEFLYAMCVAGELDREMVDLYELKVVALDFGEPPLQSETTVLVRVLDVNDNAPVFGQEHYEVHVPEDAAPGSSLVQVTARDKDEGFNSELRFSIPRSRHGHLVHIHPESGLVTSAAHLDREREAEVHFLVVAVDGGSPPQSSTATVTVYVEDVNDNKPVFDQPLYNASVVEHTAAGTCVLQGGLGTQAYVHIEVEDLNDNAPVFNPEKYVTSVSSHAMPGTEILNVIAADRDSGSYGEITYNIVPGDSSSFFSVDKSSGNLEAPPPRFHSHCKSPSYRISSGDPSHLFSVDPRTGLIYTSQTLDHETLPTVLLSVQAHASDSPVHSSTQVNVTIDDINDNSPVFPWSSNTISVSQNTLPGTVLFIAHAHDRDSGSNGKIQYSLKSEHDLFSIDPLLGMLSLNSDLSSETQILFKVKIVAQDEGSPSLTSTMTLTVEVDPSSAAEETLAFETLVYQVEISENAQRDTRVLQVRAHGGSHDRGPITASAPGFSYKLENLSGSSAFIIHPDSGWMFLSESLDYETTPSYHFSVRATAQGSKVEVSATATVVVKVLDENDNAPVFTRERYFFTVEEGPSPLGLVGTVKASDRDSGRNGHLSYILLSDGKHFRVNSKTGEITNWVALDREQQMQHILKIMVTDQGHPRLTATTAVHIRVTDVNDNPPQFTHLPAGKELNVQVLILTGAFIYKLLYYPSHYYIFPWDNTEDVTTYSLYNSVKVAECPLRPLLLTAALSIFLQVYGINKPNSDLVAFRHFSVPEDTKLGTVIGSLGLSKASVGPIRYSVAEGDGSLHFGVDGSSGDLYLVQPLDYEATQRYTFSVRAEAIPTVNTTTLVSVSVGDVNDHAPWFPGSDGVLAFGLAEDVAAGTIVYAFNARDADGSLLYSALHYALTVVGTEEPPFHIDQHTGVLVTTRPLDRERSDSHAFIVTVTDGVGDTAEARQASVLARVYLQDVNDNSPGFASSNATLVPEDAEVGSLVHQVIAMDPDEGENGQVMYSLIYGNESGLFLMEETGLLYLASMLDYEAQAVHTLIILASDAGQPSLSSTQTLTIAVGDVNDHAPRFLHKTYNATVAENREPGEPVISVSAADADSGTNLSRSNLFSLFKCMPQGGSTVLCQLSTMMLSKIQGCDSGFQPLTGTATVLCSVLDENDNDPEFMQTEVWITIPENLSPGEIHTAQASDADRGQNGTVKYMLQDPTGNFIIDGITGIVSTTQPLDREKMENYTLIITAYDQGPTPRSSSTHLHVILQDENDNSPVFTRQSYHATVSEILPVGSEVIQLSARDPDRGPSGEVTYSLTEDSPGAFAVEASTGVVRTTRPLDRETRSQYNFRAVATDNCSRGPRSSFVMVTVQVEDINDNVPVCAGDPTHGLLDKGAKAGQVVAIVTAEDPDQGANGSVVFSLVEERGDRGGLSAFEVGKTSGEVRLITPHTHGVSEKRMLRVIASDQGQPPLTSTCLVLLHLKEEEEGLRFTDDLYEVAVPENIRTGSWVANVFAHKQNMDEGQISYSIFSGNENGAFSINPHTGLFVFNIVQNCLDYEDRKKIYLVVLADNSQQATHTRVVIALQDVNDNPPTFKQEFYRTSIWEGQIHSTYILFLSQAFAVDPDSGVNGQIDYSIVSGNHNDAFIIDSVRGILATNTVLDREIISSYKLVLQAVDRGNPPLTGTSIVSVKVVDVNDNSPAIPPIEPVVIAENLPAGYFVTRVTANDVDLSSTLTYHFAGNERKNGSFAIDTYTGVITLTHSLDREQVEEYTLRVLASDSVHQAEADVHIQVLDVNDNAPVFSQDSYQVEFPELTSSGTFVLAVSATDRDAGLNGRISYRLLSSSLTGFYIDTENGNCTLTIFRHYLSPLKLSNDGNMILLLVEARDSGDPILSTVTSISIHVLDVNDHAPHFLQNTFSVAASEDLPLGSTLLTLSAEDGDYSDENVRMDYAITAGNDERRFCIEVVTVQGESQSGTVGQLVLCDSLDRETTEKYRLTVTVSDRGEPRLNSSAIISVVVLDVNDNAPVFGSSEYHVQVRENSLPGTSLVQVSAHDCDQGVNGTVLYDILSGNSKGHVRLDRYTGVLEVNTGLDLEKHTKYTLTIQASDDVGPSKRKVDYAVVFISVLDENDNYPYFMFSTVNCSVLENQPAFTPVCMVHAVDHDVGPFGQLTYSILSTCFMDYGSGNPDRKEAFAINPLSGDIHTRQTFDYERESEYCFVVEARDKGDQVATVRVQIDIEGLDEFSPVFTKTQYCFHLPENSQIGQTIGQVFAMDHDGGLDGVVEYSLVSEPTFFGVNKTTGAIYVSESVYRKRSSTTADGIVELQIQASSPKLDSRSNFCSVIVNISNLAEAQTGMSLSVQTISLSVSLTVFLLLLISFVALVLSCKTKDAALIKAASLAANLNNGTGTFGRSGGHQQNGIDLHDLRGRVDMRAKLDASQPFRGSDMSGRGSAEGETAEDHEIKMINENPTHKSPDSSLSDQGSRVPDSGVPRDSDQLSFMSEDKEPSATHRANLDTGLASSKSLHNFKEEGGGEGMLPRLINVRDLEETFRRYTPLDRSQETLDGSLSSLVCSEELLRGSYSWDYLLSWEPCFQPLASVFNDIGMLPDEEVNTHGATELHSLIRPPPLITAVAQPGIRAVPPRMPHKMSSLSRRPSYPKYSYSPLGRNTGLTPSAMTPSFSPSLSLLTVRTPNASPVVSETGLGMNTKTAHSVLHWGSMVMNAA